jgi:multidrug efflux pump subunit AcrB
MKEEKAQMWIVKLALSRPYTFVVLALVLILISPVVLLCAPVDIFPNINIPVISVIWTYSGLAPAELGTRIVSIFKGSLTTSRNNIEHIESQSLKGVAVVKVFGYLDAAFAQTALLSNERVAAQIGGQRAVATVVLARALGGGWLGVPAPAQPKINDQTEENTIKPTR